MRLSTVILLVIALASAGVSAAFWSELRAERALNAELTAKLEAASVVRAPPPSPPREDPMPAGAPSSVPAPARVPARAPETPPPPPKVAQGRENDWNANQRRLMSDPKYREAWREQQRLQMTQRRDDYIEILGFTPAQADAAIELAIDQQMRLFDRPPVNPNAEDFARQQRERLDNDRRVYETQLLGLLGAEKAAQLKNYMESRQSRLQVDRFRNQLSAADALRDDQVEPLIAALHEEQSKMQEDMQEYRDSLSWEGNPTDSARKYAERQAELMKATHSRMHASASAILSGSQLEEFDSMLKRERERLEAQQRMQRIRSKLEQPAAPASGSN